MKYKTDALMVPFLFDDLLSKAKSLCSLIVRQEVLSCIVYG